MTTGQDMSEKMIATDETWEKLKQFGIEKIRNFAESEGIRREISRNGLTERETRELIRQYKKKVDKRRTNSFMPKSGETRTEIQRIYDDENGTKRTGRGKARGKFSLKSLDSSSLDTVENNTDNVQIKSGNFKNWFGDWENNPSKASKVVNEDGTPKVVYHGTDKGGFYVFDPKMSDDKISLFFSDSKVTSNSYAQSDNQQLYEVYLAIKKPYVIDAKGHMWNELDDKLGNTTREIAEKAKNQGYDGVIIENVRDMGAIVINNTTEKFYNDFISALSGGNESAVV